MKRKQQAHKVKCTICGCTFTVTARNYKGARYCKVCKRNRKLKYLRKYYLEVTKIKREALTREKKSAII